MSMDEPRCVRIARALADPTRLRILRAIAAAGHLCCGDVGRRFDVSQATISHHLRILAEAGLVEGRRDGRFIRFRAVPGALAAYRRDLARLAASGAGDRGNGRRTQPGRRSGSR